MKIDIKLYALSYASFSSEDSEIFAETIGIYQDYNEAVLAMGQNVKSDIDDGDNEDYWNVNGNVATYADDFGNEYKTYSVQTIR